MPGLASKLILLVVVLTYWPVTKAGFVWDDIVDFQKMAWLRHGTDWQHFLLQQFNAWSNYFRPLVVALFTLEIRLFDVKPGPMHAVSLAIHAFNTLLVGVLANRLTPATRTTTQKTYTASVSMLLYGLHPLLIEPITWIGCQFDLAAIFFMLLGWIANASIKRTSFRAIVVSILFFLAACSKESAVAFPLILVVLDWFALDAAGDAKLPHAIWALWKRNRLVYALTLISGLLYLSLRHSALGGFVASAGSDDLSAWAHIQETSFLYMRYWRMFIWPTMGMGPLHEVPLATFQTVSVLSVTTVVATLSIVVLGIVLSVRRNAIGGLILTVTFALLPVLHVLAAGLIFDASLYHERYAATALAMLCAWLPWSLEGLSARIGRLATLTASMALLAWIALAIISIRSIVPFWSSNLELWQWALRQDTHSVAAKDELISAYIDNGDNAKAWQLISVVVSSHVACTNCMLNAASLAIHENNPAAASFLLDRVKDSAELHADKRMYRFYLTLISEQLLLQNRPQASEQIARSAMAMDPLDPTPPLALATALAVQGKLDEAQRVESAAVLLLPPDKRSAQLRSFESFLELLREASKAHEKMRP
jgi:hypothetical protein